MAHDLNELAEAASGGARHAVRKRMRRLRPAAKPRMVADEPSGHSPFMWGFGIAIGMFVAGFLLSILVWAFTRGVDAVAP